MSSPTPSRDGDADYENDDCGEKKQRRPRGPYEAPRKLMRWNRRLLPSREMASRDVNHLPADVDRLVLLCVDHVGVKLRITLARDEIAEEVNPDMSGEAIKRHLAKVYKYREENGKQVP